MRQAKVRIETSENSEKRMEHFETEGVPFHKGTIIRQLLKQKSLIMAYLHFGGKEFDRPERIESSGITNAWFIALDCFGVQQFPATIMFASVAVENVLNHDSRLYEYRQKQRYKWIDLTEENLDFAGKAGLPTSELLDEKSSLEEFVIRRNKIAHGDLIGYLSFYEQKYKQTASLDELAETVMITERHALDQLCKSFNFIKKWGQQWPTVILED